MFEIVSTLNLKIKVFHILLLFCSHSFLNAPSVALLITFNSFSLFSFQGADSNSRLDGGDNRDRTDDPLLAKQVLSQLSYTPIRSSVHI